MKKFFKLSILSAALLITISTIAPANSSATAQDDRFNSRGGNAVSQDTKFISRGGVTNNVSQDSKFNSRPGATIVKLYCHYKILGRHYVSSISNDKDMNACRAASGIADSNSSNY